MLTVDELIQKWERNTQKMKEKDRQSKEKGLLKGRFLNIPYADGYAYYEIIRENKNTVRIRVITDIGDDYVIPYIGEENTVNKGFALQNIGMRDFLEDTAVKKIKSIR